MILEILKFPSSELKNKSNNIKKITKNTKTLIKNMLETMHYNNGLGLAAIQIGTKKNILLINMLYEEKKILTIINPKIINKKGKTENKEGCLSFPDIYLNVKRHKIIKVKFMSLDKKIKKINVDNLLAICIQHEIDHLNGITLYDKVSNIKKNLILKKIK